MGSYYSDGGVTGSIPPTPQDYLMRLKHTKGSVEYNLKHAEDHMAELEAQLGKLYGVSRGEASKLAYKTCAFLDKVYGSVEKYKIHEDQPRGEYE